MSPPTALNRSNYVSPTYKIQPNRNTVINNYIEKTSPDNEEDVPITDRSATGNISARHQINSKGQYSFAGRFAPEDNMINESNYIYRSGNTYEE
jgi:hypothetical protein